MFFANDANLLGENKRTSYEGNEKGPLLVASNEFSLVANAEVKVWKIHKTVVRNKCFECLNIWEKP